MNITKTKDKVKAYLEKYANLRDNDGGLVSAVWYFEVQDLGGHTDEMTGTDLLKMITNGSLTAGEAITRARRKMQEEHEHLRGEKYHERHQHQDTVKDQLGYSQQTLFT